MENGQVIDMQLYPQVKADWNALTQTSRDQLEEACSFFSKQFDRFNIHLGLMLIINPDFLSDQENVEWFKGWGTEQKAFTFGCLLDFRDSKSTQLLEQARALGFVTLKLYPYLQKIEDKEFECVARLARLAESLGMYMTVCCSYGTRSLDRYSGVRLSAYLSERIRCPIIMAHAGGAKVLDAMLVAEAAENIFLDLSFSLPYYIGSSVEQDLAFAIKKVGAHRCMYGSDAPYVELEKAVLSTRQFLERHDFTDSQMQQIFSKTARRVLHER